MKSKRIIIVVLSLVLGLSFFHIHKNNNTDVQTFHIHYNSAKM